MLKSPILLFKFCTSLLQSLSSGMVSSHGDWSSLLITLSVSVKNVAEKDADDKRDFDRCFLDSVSFNLVSFWAYITKICLSISFLSLSNVFLFAFRYSLILFVILVRTSSSERLFSNFAFMNYDFTPLVSQWLSLDSARAICLFLLSTNYLRRSIFSSSAERGAPVFALTLDFTS